MPAVGEGVTEGSVTRWLKQQGDLVARDEPVVEIETDKAVVEIPAPCAGRLAHILVAEGACVPVDTPLAEIEACAANLAIRGAASSEAEAAPTTQGRAAEGSLPPSPAVRGLAAQHGIDLALLHGTGSGGRVTRRDVLRHLESAAARPHREAEVRALTPTRRTIAAHMLEAHRTIPVAWLAVEADVTGLVDLRARVREAFEHEEKVRLTYLPFFVHAVLGALEEHPEVNATFSDSEASLTVHRRCDLGIAVATDSGLVVAVLRDAGEKSLRLVAHELARLVESARRRTLAVEELRGATFTIDNTGSFGSLLSQPIVPVGQVAILTTEAIRSELRPTSEGGFAPRSVMNLCLSFDHRAIDGAEAGRFLQAVRNRLQAYRRERIEWLLAVDAAAPCRSPAPSAP